MSINLIKSNNSEAKKKTVGLNETIIDILAYARQKEYTGYDYYDGMSSRLLQSLPVENKWINILIQETIKRAPINIRPLFLVEQRQNYKGTALFVVANCCAYDLTGNTLYKKEAIRLANWLVENQNQEFTGLCGGHRHEMQQLTEKRPANTPNIIPTSYAVKALLTASRFEPALEDHALSAVRFIDNELEYREHPDGAKIKYHPLESGDYYTLNGGAIGARLYVDLYDCVGDDKYRKKAMKLLDYLETKQTGLGGWMYREPASASHLSMDNHHNGFILESYLRYTAVTGSERYRETLDTSTKFYKSSLFNPDGSPNWDETSAYPKDIHACAQGIITFSLLGDHTFAEKIIKWTFDTLYAGDGVFYYQKRKYYTKKFTLMRWCQAWMSYALSVYVLTAENNTTNYYI